MPGGADFGTASGVMADILGEIVDSYGQIRRSLHSMALNTPYLLPNPSRPRAFGGKGAERMEKGIPGSFRPLSADSPWRCGLTNPLQDSSRVPRLIR